MSAYLPIEELALRLAEFNGQRWDRLTSIDQEQYINLVRQFIQVALSVVAGSGDTKYDTARFAVPVMEARIVERDGVRSSEWFCDGRIAIVTKDRFDEYKGDVWKDYATYIANYRNTPAGSFSLSGEGRGPIAVGLKWDSEGAPMNDTGTTYLDLDLPNMGVK